MGSFIFGVRMSCTVYDVKKLLNPSGFFVSIEWPHRNSFALHMLQSLNKNGLVPQKEYLDSIETEAGDGITSLSVFVSACMPDIPEPDVNQMFFDRYFPETVIGLNRYGAWNGQPLLYVKEKLDREEKISFATGVHMYLHGDRYGRISLWEDTSDPSVCYIEQIQNEPEDSFSKIDRASFESIKKQLDDSPKGKECGDPYAVAFTVCNGSELQR